MSERRPLWIIGAVLLSLSITVQPLRDTDAWWHLALGQYISAHGIPAQEPFSFLGDTHPWVGQQWLYEVFLAKVIGAGGPGLASLLMGLLCAAAVGIAALAQRETQRGSGAVTAAALVLTALVCGQIVGVRGQVITLAGVATVLLVISRWRGSDARLLWILPPLFILWANAHAGFVAGVAVLVLAALLCREVSWSRRRTLLGVTALCALVTLINPAGPGLWGYVSETFTNPTLVDNVTEWASPNFHDIWLRLFEVDAALLVICWVASGGVDLFSAVLAGAAFVAALQAQRNVSLFAVIALPQLSWSATLALQRLRASFTDRPARFPRVPMGAALAALAMIALIEGVSLAPSLSSSSTSDFEAQRYPRAAVGWVAAHAPGQRIFAPDTWGGYVAYRIPGGRVVFLYDETAIFGDANLQLYIDIDHAGTDYDTQLARLKMTVAVVPDGSHEQALLAAIRWRVACRDAASDSLVMLAPQVAGQTTQPAGAC